MDQIGYHHNNAIQKSTKIKNTKTVPSGVNTKISVLVAVVVNTKEEYNRLIIKKTQDDLSYISKLTVSASLSSVAIATPLSK